MEDDPQPRLDQAALSVAEAHCRQLFDEAGGEPWELLVYRPVHDGWRFTNIGGRQVLDSLGARLAPGDAVLELGCGLGDTGCYLAEHFGLRYTGVEVNQAQLAAARRNRDERHPQVADRVHFIEADLGAWQAEDRYQAVLIFDTLMYLAERASVLHTARRALRPGGWLWIAEVLAGPRFHPELGTWLRETEGVVALPSPRAHAAALRRVGFEVVFERHRTKLALEVFHRICRAQRAARSRLEAIGAERFLDPTGNERHRRAFECAELVYVELGARRTSKSGEAWGLSLAEESVEI